MEELNLLKKLERVNAPPDFEQKIMAQLSLKKRERIRVKHLRFSLAGAFSAIAVLFIVINIFILPQGGEGDFPGLERGVSSSFKRSEGRLGQRDIISIIETLDYSGEIRTLRNEPSTVYILEQVSETTYADIKY